MLPQDLTGKHVLCVGVGSGEELQTLLARNPLHVTAIDISQNLLDIAQEQFPDAHYVCMDMMALEFPEESFDLLYSSLAFHYANDWDTLLTGVYRVLKPGGTLLFSTHHPNYWAKHPTGTAHTNERGVKLTEHTATLSGGVGVTYYNHPDTGSILNALEYAGFAVEHAYAPRVVEVPPHTLSLQNKKRYDNLKRSNEETPLFWVVRARK